jgi:hypothetical protein
MKLSLQLAPLRQYPSDFDPTSGTGATANSWVKLFQLPSQWSHHEALLLCQEIDGDWVAWIPETGTVKLSRGEFY